MEPDCFKTQRVLAILLIQGSRRLRPRPADRDFKEIQGSAGNKNKTRKEQDAEKHRTRGTDSGVRNSEGTASYFRERPVGKTIQETM